MANSNEKDNFTGTVNEDGLAKLIRTAAEAGAKIGAMEALAQFTKEKKKARQEIIDRRLRNTKLLLQNYRALMNHCQSAIFSSKQLEDDEPGKALDILYSIDYPLSDGDIWIESIKRTAERTHIMMSHVNEMLRLYEIYCATSSKIEDQRRYQTLFSIYLADKVKTAKEVADELHIDTRTVYKDIDAAVEKISALLYGIDGLNVTQ